MNPDEIVTHPQRTIYGDPFRCTRRTAAHLDATKERLARHSGCQLLIIQGCFNTGVAASAGTHDFDAVLDVQILGMSWLTAQYFLRGCGWAAWWRSGNGWINHIHMVSLGYTARVGIYVPGQVDDYYNRKTGLVGHYADPYPARPLPQFVFAMSRHEDDMPLNADDKKFITDAIDKRVTVLQERLNEAMSNERDRDTATRGSFREVLSKLGKK